MDGWRSTGDVLSEAAQKRWAALSAIDCAEVDDILDAAVAWERGMPLDQFARLGSLPHPGTQRPSTSYSRFVALVTTSLSDPRRVSLMRAIDAVLAFQGVVMTTSGIYDRDEIINIPIRPAPPMYRRADA